VFPALRDPSHLHSLISPQPLSQFIKLHEPITPTGLLPMERREFGENILYRVKLII